MSELLMKLAELAGLVWAATEVFGRLLRLDKAVLALILAPVAALAMHFLGFLLPEASGIKGYASLVTLALLSAAAAGVLHDYLAKPISGGRV